MRLSSVVSNLSLGHFWLKLPTTPTVLFRRLPLLTCRAQLGVQDSEPAAGTRRGLSRSRLSAEGTELVGSRPVRRLAKMAYN